jgi:tetratricopeptide (TPR) repeat protein
LCQALEQRAVIVCTGSSLARAVGIPDLEQLAESLLSVVVTRDPGLLDAAAVQTAIAERRYPDALEQLEHALGAEFDRIVERELSDRGRPVPPLARAIASVRARLRAVYTTGLDRLIERAFEGRWPSFGVPRSDLAQRCGLVFKLCGTLEFRQSWVLTRSQERRELGPDSQRRRVFEVAHAAHRLLLVGFDADSPELARLLDMFPAHPETQVPLHFIVLDECPPAQRRLLEGRGLQVVIGDALALLVELGAEPGADIAAVASNECPYPGLAAFGESLADAFFGRHAEISQAAAKLGGLVDHCHWLAIEGPSGVGKSSFVHAGIVPALRNGFAEGTPGRWVVARMRPGARPLHALVRAVVRGFELEHGREQLDALVERWRGDPQALCEFVRRQLPAGHGFVLVVDQFEEAVTMAEPDQRESFGRLLGEALVSKRIYLVTTTRTDFVEALQAALPILAEQLNEDAERYALPPISRVGLREAITEPAARVGVEVEPELVERMLADVDSGAREADERGVVRASQSALPLVAHVLRVLWEAGAADDRIIELREYVAVGGVRGALGNDADRALVDLTPEQHDGAKRLLLGLVRIDEDGRATRRTLAREQALALAGGSPDGEMVLARLTGAVGRGRTRARLLVVGRDSEAELERVELIHEALVRDWSTLRAWIEQNRLQLLLDDELDRRARRWDEAGRPLQSSDLPAGRELGDLLAGRAHGERAGLHDEYQAALQAVEAGRNLQARRRRIAVMSSLGAVAAISLVASLVFADTSRQLQAAHDQSEADNAKLAQSEKSLQERNVLLAQTQDELVSSTAQSNTRKAMLAISAATCDPAQRREYLHKQLASAVARLDQQPNDPRWQVEVRNSRVALGDLEVEAGDLDAAQAHYTEALALTKGLVGGHSTDPLAKQELGLGHQRLGTLALRRGDGSRALTDLDEALAIREQLSVDAPSNAEWKFDLALSHLDLVDLYTAGGQQREAEQHFGRAEQLIGELDRAQAIDGLLVREQTRDRVRAGLVWPSGEEPEREPKPSKGPKPAGNGGHGGMPKGPTDFKAPDGDPKPG